MSLFRCPVCSLSLTLDERTYRCEKGHAFDIAKEGYINLLLANQKNSNNPGDSKAMIRSRKAFLERGYYHLFAEAITAQLTELTSDAPVVLDAGCGEGYYTDYIYQNIADATLYGVDISKDAVRYAAKSNQEIHYAVASIASLPIIDNCVDAIVSVFAPRDADEIKRVLNDDGILITATPAPTHLIELRQMIYDEVRPYSMMEADAFAPQFEQIDSQLLMDVITLTDTDEIANLLQMTPFFWHCPTEKRDALLSLPQLELQIAFEIATWRISASS